MKRVLIHVHIYYAEMWPELKACLQNVFATTDCRLFVTIVAPNEALEKDIKAFCPAAAIEVVENRGFDIAPFLHILNKVDLQNFDYIVKLHTKRHITTKSFVFNGFDLSGDRWRQYLLSFCQTPENWQKTLRLLEGDSVTMVSECHLISDADKSIDIPALRDFERRFGLVWRPHQAFVSGTMFAAKARLFLPLQHKISPAEFLPTTRDGTDKLPYLCEVLFGCLAPKNTIVSFDGKKASWRRGLAAFGRFIWRHKISPQKEIIKVCGIPIYRKKLK